MKSFLKSDMALRILSLLIAVALWYYVAQVQSPETDTTVSNVPVVFTQKDALESKGLILLKDKEHTVDLKLRGRRKTLVELNSSNITVIADVGQIDAAGTYPIVTNVVLPVGSVEILKKTPATVDVEVDELATKELAVEYRLTGTPRADYVTGDVRTDPATVVVSGPKTVVDGVASLQADVDVEGKDADVATVTELKMLSANDKEINSPYVTLSTAEVQVTCQILKTKTVGLRPALSDGLLASDQAYELDPGSVKTVRIAGAGDALDRLDSVDTETITELQDNAVQVGLSLPTGVRSLDGDKFILRFVNKTKTTKTVSVSPIAVLGVASDLTAELARPSETVTLIGSADALSQLTTLSGSVDLTGLPVGTHTVPLRLSYRENVWPDRTYYVEATVRKNGTQ